MRKAGVELINSQNQCYLNSRDMQLNNLYFSRNVWIGYTLHKPHVHKALQDQ